MTVKTIDEAVQNGLKEFMESGEPAKLLDSPNILGCRVAYLLHLLFDGLHHLDDKTKAKVDWMNIHHISINLKHKNFATYDGNLLTRLVILSHDLMLRVEIDAANFGVIKVTFHERSLRDGGSIFERMPLLETQVDSLRLSWFGFTKAAGSGSKAASSPRVQTMDLDEACQILNDHKFKPKGHQGDVQWRVSLDSISSKNESIKILQAIILPLPLEGDAQVAATLTSTPAIHRARQLIRRDKLKAERAAAGRAEDLQEGQI